VDLDAVRPIADAVLYEGYLLYPYRASADKNRNRWQFGVVMPTGYALTDPSERSFIQAECVVEGDATATVGVALRFLHPQRRTVQRWTGTGYDPTDVLDVDGTPLAAWEEAVEHEIVFEGSPPYLRDFAVEPAARTEPVMDRHGRLIGRVIHRRRQLRGTVLVATEPVPGPWRASRLRVRVDNRTHLPGPVDRSTALLSALVGCHAIIGVADGAFLSMVDSPEWAAAAVADCVNIGTWPVLAGPPGRRDLMLCAPIILYDHPRVAPESTGDLFDATEIDEILSLRTRALTDVEKRAARATDPRAAALIDRVEALDSTQLHRLHGTIRDPRPAPAAADAVVVAGREVRGGSRVRLRPGTRRSDAQDMFLTGRIAVVEAVLHDVEDNIYLAVTLADDPAADLQRGHGRFWYFAPDEVEPCDG
jgi:hypothetical protein